MSRYSLTHVSNGILLQNLHSLVGRDRATTAELLAHIAEVEERKLYRPIPCSSMFDYCVRKLRMSEDEANRRINAARAARKHPFLFEAIADGRLHLTGLSMLSRHLTESNARELVAAATHKTKTEIEELLADRCPRPDLQERISALATTSLVALPVPEQVTPERSAVVEPPVPSFEPNSAAPLPVPERVAAPVQSIAVGARGRDREAPLGMERYGFQFTGTRGFRDKLRRAQDLLGRQVPAGSLVGVFELALDALIADLEKRKFAATPRPRNRTAKPSNNPRTIPARVRRAVRERDGERCAFVGDGGHRCEARRDLEFDHIVPVARGGESTVANVRLLCRAHNQLAAERVLGYQFMNGRRETAAEARETHGMG